MKNRTGSPSQIKPFFSIAFYSLRAMLRNRATVFFGFAFPLIFISVFGLFGGNGVSLTVGIPDSLQKGSMYEALSGSKAIKVEGGSEVELQKKLVQGRIAGVLKLEETASSIQLSISQADPQQAAAVTSLISGVVNKLNLKLANITNPPISLDIREVSGRDFKFIDFFLPGIIGFALLATAVPNTAFGLIFLKKTLVLKRIFATPTKGSTILVGQAASRLIIVLAQALVILGVGVVAFNFNLVHGFFTVTDILILSVIGLFSFLGFGLFVAGLSNEENTVAPIAQLIILPQFLVAGTFFPVDALPAWIQPAVNTLPLAFFNTAIRKITVEGLSFDHLLPQLLGLAVWSIIAYAAASRTFKWE
ncbi:MAG: hypothetical protein A2Z11_01005 [Candidatus Woykebacteria bacterium RBG_16_43_9]|uniref:Transport permease protein n=1 Tax=Candidatus Woykebacteria bacterium RBG_16_43_9 TaxID=1802596 RepID=A0A1G1WC13_9BACT|nr:MAG: hypothetical protein A2Z11_01005 [Candidatus Woykebacteria bacterium RBG_16_43_9]